MGKRQLVNEEQESASKQAKMGSEAEAESDQAKLAAVSPAPRSRCTLLVLFRCHSCLYAQPQAADECMMEAWYMDESNEDQRVPHK